MHSRRVTLSTAFAALAALLLAASAQAAPRAQTKGKDQPKGKPAAAKVEAKPAEPAKPGKPDRPWTDDVVYFVILDRYADGDPTNDQDVKLGEKGTFHGGDLKGLIAHLDDIADLGATAIWVTPLVLQIPKFVLGAGFPDWGYHGYWAEDYSKLDPRFGTEEDLAKLVDEAHRRGIKILLDVVYNHCGYDADYTIKPETRMWLRQSSRGTCGDEDTTSCLAGLPDWKTEEPEVRDWLLDKQLAWPKRFAIDGFRLDTVKHVDHAFWQEHRKRTRAIDPKFFLLGEVFGGETEWMNNDYFGPDELDAALDFTFKGSVGGWLLGRGRTASFHRYLVLRDKTTPGHLMAQYLSSHDVRGELADLNGDKELFKLAAVLELTTYGLPVIMYGEEVGQKFGDWPYNRPDYPWGDKDVLPGKGVPRDESMLSLYKKLLAIRRSHLGMTRGPIKDLSTGGDLYVFARAAPLEGDAVVVAVNRSATPQQATFPAPQEWQGLKVEELLWGAPFTLADGKVTVTVPPRQAQILGVNLRKR